MIDAKSLRYILSSASLSIKGYPFFFIKVSIADFMTHYFFVPFFSQKSIYMKADDHYFWKLVYRSKTPPISRFVL